MARWTADALRETPPRLVCFDAGGVLVRICRSWRERCDRAGIEFRFRTDDEPETPAWHAAHHALETGRLTEREYFEAVASAVGGRYSAEELHTIHVAWIIEEYPGVGELVRALRDMAGIETALLSNTNAVHWRTPPMLGTPDSAVASVDRPHASHLLGHAKPGVEVFRAFERATGFDGDSILFFEDTQANVDAARGIGWRAELIDHEGDTAAQIGELLARHGIRL